MMTAKLRNANPSRSLAAQINDAERHRLERQRSVGVRGSMLRHNIHERMTSPDLLWLAGGLGFLLGRLTRHKADRSPGSDHSLFWMAVNSMPWARALFTALLSGAAMQVSSQSDVSVQTPEPSLRSPAAPADERAAWV